MGPLSLPFTNLLKACGKNGKLQTHSRSQYHKDAAARAQALTSTILNPETIIQQCISQQAHDQYQDNLRVLSTIVRAILFCGRQNIALRGHRDDHTSDNVNKGNFIALLNLLAEFDQDLSRHLQFGKKICRYTSETIQNQLLAITGDIIREEVTVDIKDDDTFPLLQVR